MSLAFLVPAFLLGALAIAVPVILHLRHRESNQPLRFPSLMFLERLSVRSTQRQRVTDWPLLLLRAGALILLAIAFARPFVGRPAASAAQGRDRAVALLLDRSLSMSHQDVWPAALDSARRVIAGLEPGDRIAVVLFDDEAEVAQPLTDDRAAALAAVNAARPTSRGTRYAAALRAGRQALLDAQDAAHELIVITDLQRSGVAGLAGVDLPADLTVRAVAVGTARRGNANIVATQVQRRSDAAGARLAVQARVVTRELDRPRRARLSLVVNGRPSGSRDVTLPAAGTATVAFDPVTPPAGRIRGVVHMDADALARDDTFHFAAPADDDVRVLLVTPPDRRADETLFFEHALAVGRSPLLRVTRQRAGAVDAGALDRAALVVLWDVIPGGATAASLTSWVRDGGGLVIVAGRRLAARAGASTLLPGSIQGLADRLADRGGALADATLEHPLFTAFRQAPGALQAARFLRYPRVEPGPGADVIARFDDGLPAVIERREGSGRTVLIGVPLDGQAGDFPLQPAYLPFLRHLVLYAVGHEAAPLWRVTGEHWLARVPAREPVLETPAGEILRPRPDSGGVPVPLTQAGFYALHEGRVGAQPLAILAANPPPGESDLTPVDARELLLGVRQSDSTSAGSTPITVERAERSQALWRIVLVVLAALLLGETILANRGWRGIAGRAS